MREKMTEKYNEFGFDKNMIHKDTGTEYDPDGFDMFGEDAEGNLRLNGKIYKNSTKKRRKKKVFLTPREKEKLQIFLADLKSEGKND